MVNQNLYIKEGQPIHWPKEKNKDKRTNNDLQNITRKTKYKAKLAPLIIGVNSGALEW
jgi:hypothetical protein